MFFISYTKGLKFYPKHPNLRIITGFKAQAVGIINQGVGVIDFHRVGACCTFVLHQNKN